MTARTMRRGGLGLGAALVVVAAIVLSLGAGQAKALTPWLYIDTSPGTGAPPPTLGGYGMIPFPPDPQPELALVTSVAVPPTPLGALGPQGSILFSEPVTHAIVPSTWNNWSHGYTGDVYYTTGSPDEQNLTITLPPRTAAFYFYTEGDLYATIDITATGKSAFGWSTSVTRTVTTPLGATYVGVYSVSGGFVKTVSVHADTEFLGFAVGEFGINGGKIVKAT